MLSLMNIVIPQMPHLSTVSDYRRTYQGEDGKNGVQARQQHRYIYVVSRRSPAVYVCTDVHVDSCTHSITTELASLFVHPLSSHKLHHETGGKFSPYDILVH